MSSRCTPTTLHAIPELSPEEALGQQQSNHALVCLDVRDSHEHATGTIPHARCVPQGERAAYVASLFPDCTTPILCVCASGTRSLQTATQLRVMGYTSVASLRGGVRAWREAGLPVTGETTLAADEQVRYQRHVMLPEIGLEGQRALGQARVLIVGIGGLGSPVAAYLAAVGVGTLGLVDDDHVELSNLQRQILFATPQVGTSKTHAAGERLRAMNPLIRVEPHQGRVEQANAASLIARYDLVVDGSDNFPTRYLLNDHCLRLRKPLVYGSVYRFEGQVSTFVPGQGPCYRCLYPIPPTGALSPNCAEAGVLGVLPGIIGTLQAAEAIKWILRCGTLLMGRLLHFDGLNGTFREILVTPRATCSCQIEDTRRPVHPVAQD